MEGPGRVGRTREKRRKKYLTAVALIGGEEQGLREKKRQKKTADRLEGGKQGRRIGRKGERSHRITGIIRGETLFFVRTVPQTRPVTEKPKIFADLCSEKRRTNRREIFGTKSKRGAP